MNSVRSALARKGLVRARRGKLLGGVSAGLARRFGTRPAFVRIAFVLSLVIPGPQTIVYLLLWFLMPVEGRLPPGSEAPPRLS